MFHFDLIRYAGEGHFELGEIAYTDCSPPSDCIIAMPSDHASECLNEMQVADLRHRYEVKTA